MSNQLAGFLAVYAQESLEQYIANMPSIDLFTKNFDTSIADGGLSVTTRISNTVWPTAGDLSTNGYASTAASSSAITATLKERAYDISFSELEWATITPQMLNKMFTHTMAKQLANSITVDAINVVTSSFFTNTQTPGSSSLYTVTGALNSLAAGAALLDNLEIGTQDRYAIVSPNIYQSLASGVTPTYIYGDSDAVKRYKIQELQGFQLHKYPRFYGATKPQGGNYIGTGGTSDKLVGILGHRDGIVCAVRSPVDVNVGLVQSATAVDSTSGLSIQCRIIYDASYPKWRIAVVAVWGVAAGNPNAVVPIITSTT